MKTVIQALAFSFAIHVIYIVSVLLFSYIQTTNYKPELESAWENAVILQDEVAFGVMGSPFILVYSFIGIALISGLFTLIYSIYKKDASPNIG